MVTLNGRSGISLLCRSEFLLLNLLACGGHRASLPEARPVAPVFDPLQQDLKKSYATLFEIAPGLEYSASRITAMREYLKHALLHRTGMSPMHSPAPALRCGMKSIPTMRFSKSWTKWAACPAPDSDRHRYMGVDKLSEHDLNDRQKRIEAENMAVFVAGAGSLFRDGYEPSMTLAQAQAFLQMAADKRGRLAWFVTSFAAFPDAVQGPMQSIEIHYRLVYQGPVRAAGKFHKIKVEAFRIVNDKRKDYTMLVRSSSQQEGR